MRRPDQAPGARSKYNSSPAIESIAPVTVGDARDAYDSTATGRVNKTVLAKVDSHVRVGSTLRVEKNKIAGL